MRARPFTNLGIAIALFVIISLVGARFRNPGTNWLALGGVLIGTLLTFTFALSFIWPDRNGGPESGRINSLLSFVIAGLFTALFLLDTYHIPSPKWMRLAFYVLGGCNVFYLWILRRKNARRNDIANSLQMRLIAKNRDHLG